MYLGMVLILTGIAFLLATLTPFIIVPLFAVIIDRVFIDAEETVLEERFGVGTLITPAGWVGAKLTPAARQAVTKGNYERLFDEALLLAQHDGLAVARLDLRHGGAVDALLAGALLPTAARAQRAPDPDLPAPLREVGFDNPSVTVNGSSIHSNGGWQYYTNSFDDPAGTVLDATQNWWGTTSTAAIAAGWH